MQRLMGSLLIFVGLLTLVAVLDHLYFARVRGLSKRWVSSIAWTVGDTYKVLFTCDLRWIIAAAILSISAGAVLWGRSLVHR